MQLKNRLTATLSTVVLALTLAACGDNPEQARRSGPTEATAQTTQESTDVETTHNDADTQFVQMMIVHHQGAIEMADLAVEKAQTDDMRALAEDISAAQGPEIEQMISWLQAWDEDTMPMDDAGQMDHGSMDHGGMEMEGMGQDEAMAELSELSGSEFDTRFLELMIAHHEGAVTMAETELAEGQNPQALELAQTIINDQQDEIAEMKQMLPAL